MLCNLCVSLGASIAGYPALTGNAIENQELGELIYKTMNPYKNQELWALHYVNLMLQFKKPGVRLVNFTIYVFPIKNQLYDFNRIEQNFGNKVISFSFLHTTCWGWDISTELQELSTGTLISRVPIDNQQLQKLQFRFPTEKNQQMCKFI